MSIRFDYVEYDDCAKFQQKRLRIAFEHLETLVFDLSRGRSRSLAETALEESYMWVGKAIRDDQVIRTNEPVQAKPDE